MISSLQALFAVLVTFMVTVVISMVAINVYSGAGSMLPVWMLINSIQLFAYTVLLDIPMPSNSAYFLRRFLDALRINLKDDFFEIEPDQAESYLKMLKNDSNDYERLHL